MMRGLDAPMARAASMYCILRSTRACERSSRDAYGDMAIASANITIWMLAPSGRIIAIANTMLGIAIKVSVKRWIIRSVMPPKYAPAMPQSAPKVMPSVGATSPTMRDTRPPCSNRLNRSRVMRSVPSTCILPSVDWVNGSAKRVPVRLFGSKGATTSAKSVPDSTIANTISATDADG